MKTAIKLSLYFSLLFSTSDYAAATTTNIVPSAATGTNVTPTAIVPPPGTNYQINGGQSLGGSTTLLETFTSFNLASPDTVTFPSGTSYTNLIVRVIGGASTIDGKLTSSIPNFYFINPAGVTFGANAVIDVPAGFHVSTADKMTFNNYLIDAHSATPASVLSVAAPDSFGFLGGSNSSVTVTGASSGSTLSVISGNAFDIVANNINIGSSTTTANLNAPSGKLRLVAFKGTGNVSVDASTLPAQSLLATNGSGNITISNNSTVSSSGGHSNLWGGNISVDNATISAPSTTTSSGDIKVIGGTLNVINSSSITTSSSNTGTAGSITINSDTVNIRNAGSITSSANSSGNAGNISVISKTMNIDAQNNTTAFTGISSSAISGTGAGGAVDVVSNVLNILDGGTIRTSTYTNANAGTTNVTANVLTIDAQGNGKIGTGILSRANSGSATNTGNAGTVLVNAGNLQILNGGQISTDTFTKGNAGTVTVNANSVLVSGSAGTAVPSKISSGSRTSSTGQTGNVNVTASQSIQLQNGGSINIKSDAQVATVAATNSAITITAPDISLTNSSITSAASKNDNAGDITVNFANLLNLNSSFITTTANTGNGGTITINGGNAIYLGNSGFLTSVSGATSNGGNINVNADTLAMNTAVIQANAIGGSGGDISIFLQDLIASQNTLILGGSRVFWQPNIPGFNVIQAASESGVSGTVSVNSPQFDISGSVSGLDTAGLVMPNIGQNPCGSLGSRSSSLTRGSKGGIPVSESKAGFIPSADTLPKAQSDSKKTASSEKIIVADASQKGQKDYSCTPLPF